MDNFNEMLQRLKEKARKFRANDVVSGEIELNTFKDVSSEVSEGVEALDDTFGDSDRVHMDTSSNSPDIEDVTSSPPTPVSEPFVLPDLPHDTEVHPSNMEVTVDKVYNKIDRKVWQNPESASVKSMQQVVENFIVSLLETLKQNNPLWNSVLLKCGSYYEGLRVGLPLEFDFMLQLEYFKAVDINPFNSQLVPIYDNMEVKLLPNSPLGNETPDELYLKAQIDYTRFKRNMVPNVREVLRKHKTKDGLKLIEVSDHNNSPNLCLYLTYQGQGIMVDLVTCVKFPENCANKLPAFDKDTLMFFRDEILQEQKYASDKSVEKFMLSRLHLVSTNVENKWRISTSILEKEIMKKLPNETKSSLRVIKHLCHLYLTYDETFDVKFTSKIDALAIFGYKQFVPTYMLKLLFLHEVIELHCTPNIYLRQQTNKSKAEIILDKLILRLKEYKIHQSKDFSLAKVQINSILFGSAIPQKFDFGQDIALLMQHESRQKKLWYVNMIDIIAEILKNESGGNKVFGDFYKLLNYPLIDGAACYPKREYFA